jgi:alpha-tubulin suppressor-like RCC1 family protein
MLICWYITSKLTLMFGVLLADDSTVWGCGWNAYGQLGISPEHVQCTWMMMKMELPNSSSGMVLGVECGAWSTAVFLA